MARSSWLSLPTVVAIATMLGAGLGVVVPATRPGPTIATADRAPGPAAIEPAAGPATAIEIARAPDRRFYAPVLLDSVPVTMELAPQAPRTLLAPSDAGRLAVGGAAASAVEIRTLELGPVRHGPVLLQLGPAGSATSVLGADLLDRLAVVGLDGERMRLTPR